MHAALAAAFLIAEIWIAGSRDAHETFTYGPT